MADYEGDLVCGSVTSQAVAAGEKDPTEVKKKDLWRGFARVNMSATEKKVLIPGEKVRGQAEKQYGPEEVPHGR